jgi:hypothetical protein
MYSFFARVAHPDYYYYYVFVVAVVAEVVVVVVAAIFVVYYEQFLKVILVCVSLIYLSLCYAIVLYL